MTLPPAQNVVGPLAVITGVGGTGLTVTVTEFDVALQPFALVTVTVYAPAALTLMRLAVEPFDQR